jgi:hypothetical protein
MSEAERDAWAAFEAGILADAAQEMEHLQLQQVHLRTYISVTESYLHDYLDAMRIYKGIAQGAYEQMEARYQA